MIRQLYMLLVLLTLPCLLRLWLLTTAAEHSQFLQVCLVLTDIAGDKTGHSLIRTALIRHILTSNLYYRSPVVDMPDDPAAVHVACAVNATCYSACGTDNCAEHSQFLQVCLVLTDMCR